MAESQPDGKHAWGGSQLRRGRPVPRLYRCERHDLAGNAKAVHRKRSLIVVDGIANVVQVVLIMNATLQVIPRVLRLRDTQEVPIDLSFEIKGIRLRVVGIAGLKFSGSIGHV